MLAFAGISQAHLAAFTKGMYCLNGNNPAHPDLNTDIPVRPLYELEKADWWFQHDRKCDAAPPPAGNFLEIPANGQFTVEIAKNQAFTSLSYDGSKAGTWPDGENHPDSYGPSTKGEDCVGGNGGFLHAQDEQSAAGTAFAISYGPLSAVTMENLVVFTTKYHTPWQRVTTYEAPDLPACPEEGCTCAWLWVPKGCGQPNMYMQGHKCKVTGAKPTAKKLAAAKPPVYCEGDASKCVKGAKQMIAWNQKSGNNIETEEHRSPGYNANCGWTEGAQTDIFETGNSVNSTSTPPPQGKPGSPSKPTPTFTTLTRSPSKTPSPPSANGNSTAPVPGGNTPQSPYGNAPQSPYGATPPSQSKTPGAPGPDKGDTYKPPSDMPSSPPKAENSTTPEHDTNSPSDAPVTPHCESPSTPEINPNAPQPPYNNTSPDQPAGNTPQSPQSETPSSPVPDSSAPTPAPAPAPETQPNTPQPPAQDTPSSPPAPGSPDASTPPQQSPPSYEESPQQPQEEQPPVDKHDVPKPSPDVETPSSGYYRFHRRGDRF
ncbi:hypothetical protein EJ05DRAFT_447590 [Pseudovirgaria hyperparasitica]|uniref:Uncharacterized protein n=1 Tax=Pseudovirgaria hyperparasitica TaxID=470096 RepID=A0A6A6WLU0_9PEZI|nr:uncharacterized protein EJ05DRAFT_447590 [Pseudovirgaria hyperparasitica]KAF2763167.1 hypothetical protein EJ05DRAFT_447590 [Pseudovirgaria hyperparasitica]